MEGFFQQNVGTIQGPATILQNSICITEQIKYLIDLLAKKNTELQEEKTKKDVLQEELENLKASCDEVCQSRAANQEKFDTELQEEKRMKNDLEEEV